MHLKPDINTLDFLKEVAKCSSDVLFETPEGDRLALKSTLSRFIFCTIASKPELLQSGTIRIENEMDHKILDKFLCDSL